MRKTSLRCSDTPLLGEHFSPLKQKPEEKTISCQSSNLKSPKKYFTYGGGDAGGTWHWFISLTPPQLSNSFFCKVFNFIINVVMIFAHNNPHLWLQTIFTSLWFYSVASNHLENCVNTLSCPIKFYSNTIKLSFLLYTHA